MKLIDRLRPSSGANGQGNLNDCSTPKVGNSGTVGTPEHPRSLRAFATASATGSILLVLLAGCEDDGRADCFDRGGVMSGGVSHLGQIPWGCYAPPIPIGVPIPADTTSSIVIDADGNPIGGSAVSR